MSTISLRLPESLHAQPRALAKQDGNSLNQLIATLLAEKMSAVMTREYLKAREWAVGGVRARHRTFPKAHRNKTRWLGQVMRGRKDASEACSRV